MSQEDLIKFEECFVPLCRNNSSYVSCTVHILNEEIPQPENLQRDIQEYKQLLWDIKDENRLLKVKVRRLEESLRKKSKVVDTHYLGPHNKILFKETLTQFTYRIEQLQEENKQLKEDVFDKDHTIRQLKKKLSTYEAYKPQLSKKRSKLPVSATQSRSTTSTTVKNSENSIKEDSPRNTGRSLQQSDTQTTLSVYNIDTTPHEEIEKLHLGFKDIIEEVDKLKQSVSIINEQHIRTVFDMRDRGQDIATKYLNDEESKEDELTFKALQRAASIRSGRKNSNLNASAPQQQFSPPRRAVSAFARVQPVSANNKTNNMTNKHGTHGHNKGKKVNPYAIRTGSRNSLVDETDMKLYIDEILMDMHR